MNDPVPLKAVALGKEEDAPSGSYPVILYGGAQGEGSGGASDTALGRNILNVEGTTNLNSVPEFSKYSYVDVRGETDLDRVEITLPKASEYGPGRILYIIDKLGHIDGENWRTRITLLPSGNDGIDGEVTYTVTERHGFVALRATATGSVARQEWQVVAVNSPAHHVNSGFANWVGAAVLQPNEGHAMRWSGAHVYAPVKIEVYRDFAASKFWVRYYPTYAMAVADKDRVYGTEPAAGIIVMNEFVVGGDASAISYGTGQVVSSWDASGKPENIYNCAVTLIDGPASRFSASTAIKNMVVLT